jgi:predicted Zn-dependent protease
MADSPRLEQIQALLRDDPNDPFLLYGLSMEYLSLNDTTAAIKSFQDLITRKPEYVPTYLMLGQTLQRAGRGHEAADVLRLGVKAAKIAGDEHALSEILALLAILDDG